MARKRRKRVSEVRKQYTAQRRRLSSMVSRLRKQGYEISLADIAGDIPKRVTKKQVRLLSEIRTSKEALQQFKKLKGRDPYKKAKKAIPRFVVANSVFDSKFSKFHVQVQAVINQWKNYILQNYGEQAFLDALADADFEGINLSDYGGYLIPPEDLSLYLHRLTHFVLGEKDSPPLQRIVEKVDDLILQYESYVSTAESLEWGSWHSKNKG